MPLYNDKTKCILCGKDLTDNEFIRIGRDKTLRMCDKCWTESVAKILKVKKLWEKIGR